MYVFSSTKLDYSEHAVHWMNSYLFFKIQLLIMPLLLYFPSAPYTCHHYSVYPIINTFCPDFYIYGIHGNLPFQSPPGHLLDSPSWCSLTLPQHHTKATSPEVLPVNDKNGNYTRAHFCEAYNSARWLGREVHFWLCSNLLNLYFNLRSFLLSLPSFPLPSQVSDLQHIHSNPRLFQSLELFPAPPPPQ